MKKNIYKITSLFLVALIMSAITNEKLSSWQVGYIYKMSHHHLVGVAYGKAHDLYMQIKINYI